MTTKKLTQRQKDILIRAAQESITFTVQGRGAFPVDMLRYDRCWPAWEDQSLLIQRAVNPTGAAQVVRITLSGLKEPEVRRWASFGWTVVDINGEQVA